MKMSPFSYLNFHFWGPPQITANKWSTFPYFTVFRRESWKQSWKCHLIARLLRYNPEKPVQGRRRLYERHLCARVQHKIICLWLNRLLYVGWISIVLTTLLCTEHMSMCTYKVDMYIKCICCWQFCTVANFVMLFCSVHKSGNSSFRLSR